MPKLSGSDEVAPCTMYAVLLCACVTVQVDIPAGSKRPVTLLDAMAAAGVGEGHVEAVAGRLLDVDHLIDKEVWRLLMAEGVEMEEVLAVKDHIRRVGTGGRLAGVSSPLCVVV
jgi:hypothetical protein